MNAAVQAGTDNLGFVRIVPDSLPGADLVARGLADLASGRVGTIEVLLVTIGAPRLRTLGFAVPPGVTDPEEQLYEVLATQLGDAAHGRYNSLVRQLVSFERAACVA